MDQGEPQVEDSMFQSGQEASESVETARPEYISEQHWNADTSEVRVEALAKSFSDTKSALDAKREESGVPESADAYVTWAEDGNAVLPEGLDSLPPIAQDDPLLSSVLKAAHESGVSKVQMDGVLDAFFRGQNDAFAPYTFNPDEVYAGISEDRQQAEGIVSAVNVYLGGLGLDESGMQAASEAMSTSGGIKLLHAMTSATGVTPMAPAAPQIPTVSQQDLETRWNELRSKDLRVGTPDYDEFEKLGNSIFKGKGQN